MAENNASVVQEEQRHQEASQLAHPPRSCLLNKAGSEDNGVSFQRRALYCPERMRERYHRR